MYRVVGILPLLLLVVPMGSRAQTDQSQTADKVYEEILVTGGADAIRTLPGSAALLDEEAIAAFDITDVNELLAQVPGVYIRQEDGYGLRPNIGIRGATSERSQKITLMEDGMLIAPAPYSAPAAYYFPNVNRMAALEVFKGLAAIQYGPHTIGGAVNLVTPPVPTARTGLLNISYGSDGYYKGRVFHGDQVDQWGYRVDALRYGAEGFKELDGKGDTGFVRNDLNAKLQWRSSESSPVAQTLQVKIGYADEESDETYLGLTDADFASQPQRRYAASALDQFTSEHSQLHLVHSADFGNGWELHSKGYLNRFDRSWNKFDGLFPTRAQYQQDGYASRVSAAMIFEHAQSDPQRLALIRGDVDSDGSLEQTLDITDNARQYGSHGLEVNAVKAFVLNDWQHKTTYGVRYHHDYVERDHRVRGYHMESGQLIWDGDQYANKALNKAESDALATYINHEMSMNQWLLTAGVRGEWIEGQLTNELNATETDHSEEVLIPGFGAFYQWSESLGLLLGINKGFSPNGPGASEAVDPEESINYEYGFRYQGNRLNLDVVGFFSDYQNLVGRCRVSDAQCEAGEEFNGGNVEVSGLELTASYEFNLSNGWFLPLSLAYTYTESAFQDNFDSNFSQWGEVAQGDELPYMPEHQVQLMAGLIYGDWLLNLGVKHVGEMRERPGRGQPAADEFIEAYSTVDVSARYQWDNQWSWQLIAENLADEQVIVSRKPFGARPNSPRMIKASLTYEF